MDYSNVEAVPPLDSHYFSVFLQGLSGIFFIFLNHQFIFPLISNLKRPTKKRVDRIFLSSLS
jgi:amino acid permease